MDKIYKSMALSVGKSVAEGVVIDNRPYRQATGKFPQGHGTWAVALKKNVFKMSECFVKEGDFEAIMSEAKKWAREKNATLVYLVTLPESKIVAEETDTKKKSKALQLIEELEDDELEDKKRKYKMWQRQMDEAKVYKYFISSSSGVHVYLTQQEYEKFKKDKGYTLPDGRRTPESDFTVTTVRSQNDVPDYIKNMKEESLEEAKYWMSPLGDTDDFGDKYKDVMYDGKTKQGPWANMTEKSWKLHGIGKLGTGYGQKYKKEGSKWKLVEGGSELKETYDYEKHPVDYELGKHKYKPGTPQETVNPYQKETPQWWAFKTGWDDAKERDTGKRGLSEGTLNESVNPAVVNKFLDNPKSAAIIHALTPWSEDGGWLSETNATVHIYGTSGRGSPKAKNILRTLADAKILETQKRGKATFYRAPKELYDIVKKHPSFTDEHQKYHDMTKKWMTDGDYPKPKNMQEAYYDDDLLEDAPTNAVGDGSSVSVDKPFKKRPKFAGSTVFDVDDDKMFVSRNGKHPRHRYKKYVGDDDVGEEIRDYAKKNPKESIILRSKSGAMIYLRRK